MHLVGHSFGGVLALHLAATSPLRIAHLTLVEPVLFALAEGKPGAAAHACAFRPIVDAIARGATEDAARRFHALWGAGDWDAMSPERRARMAQAMPIVAAQRSALFGPPAAEILDGVEAPVTLVEGGASPTVIGEIGDAIEARGTVVARHRIAGAGHMLPITHPAEVARALAGVAR
jgi:pimeloyl-ACP methyl ester carboxylesterase